MFAKLSVVLVSALAVLAIPTNGPSDPTGSSQCNTGSLQCCNSVQSSNSSAASLLLGLLGVVLGGNNVPIGITCSPLNVLGIGGGSSCNAQSVCCTGNNYSGIIVVGCSPINLGL